MAYVFRKLRLLIWKNFILQIRRPIGTCVELLLPVALLALLILARENVEDKNVCMSTYDDVSVDPTPGIKELAFERKTSHFHLAYYPMTAQVLSILQPVASKINVTLTKETKSGNVFTSKDNMLDTVKQATDYYLGAITFDNVEDGQPLPKNVKYSIRLHHSTPKKLGDNRRDSWQTQFVYPFFQAKGPSGNDLYEKIFMPLQYLIDSSIIQQQTGNPSTSAPSHVRHFPYPNYREDTFITIISSTMPTIFILAFIYTAVMIVKELVAEKQSRLKESMKMMGLANWMHWAAWFVKVMVFFLIVIILQTILLKVGRIFEFADASVVFFFLLFYTLASTFSLFFLSTLFSNAIRGMLFAAVLWFGTLTPFFAIQDPQQYESLSNGAKFGCCLLPNTCLGIAIQIISRKESSQVGIRWNTVSQAPSVDDDFSLGNCFGVLIFDCFLFGFLTWYIENVFPGEFGLPKPFYFFLTPSYWCGSPNHRPGSVTDMNGSKSKGPNFEDEPEGGEIGVSIQDLRKVYKGATGKKVAVDSLSLNIYKGQITALLGHNGAGKTTTMSILTGLFPPTAGTAYINGNSILSNMDTIRESLGLCPQHNVLFDRLTVQEHLEFFTALKGIPIAKARPEIMQMIQDIQLFDKANSQSHTLSGGMKRKLNCAIALIGGSETIFLDEPTSGMDPYARRATWDLLQKYRANKTIILTTHFMDEADYLGDRIAIMADGELRCCGSSMFLKKRYGVGYHMTIVKSPGFDETKTCSLVNTAIPSAKMVGNLGAEMSYILEESSTKQFKGLFEQLEDNREAYGITSFGVSVTTLEEVFLKVGEGESLSGLQDETDGQGDREKLQPQRQDTFMDRDTLLSGCALFISQFKAMFIKRFLNSKRQKTAAITQIVLPIFLVVCGLALMSSSNVDEDDRSRELTLSMLKEKEATLTTFFADFRPGSDPHLKKFASDHYSSVETDMEDITLDCYAIQDNNLNSQISVKYAKDPVNTTIGDPKNCCKYPFLVLNENCQDTLDTTEKLVQTCTNAPKEFGYRYCMDCAHDAATPGQPFKKPCAKDPPRAIEDTNLAEATTFFEEYVLEDSSLSVDDDYFNKKVAGFSVGGQGARVWFTRSSWHGMPSALSAGSNIMLKLYTNDSAYGIQTFNHPLPKNALEKSSASSSSGTLNLANFLAMAASFIAASFITFLVQEKTSKAKHIQFVSGVSSVCYWLATFCWDFINYLVPAIIIFILFAAFNLDEFNGELGAIFIVLILFACAMLPFVYMMSFVFTSSLIAYSVVALILLVISLAMVIAVFILDATQEYDIADALHHVFLLLPSYALPKAVMDIGLNKQRRDSCNIDASAKRECVRFNLKYRDDTFDMEGPGIGTHCLFMFLECIVYFLIVILIEEGFFLGKCFGGGRSTTFSVNAREDMDVQEERKKIHNMAQENIKNSALVVKNLTKVYRSSGMMAVDHLCFEVPKKECFGLLGVNGAGKTTTFGMLTGELGITDGTAFLDGFNIQSHLKDVQQRLGYCPQFDALIEKMTGREMLRMFARLRGCPPHKLENVVDEAIAQLNLGKWADKMCGDYSGGNKRKLSTAIALVGDPPIVFLDEPTSGMDPASRRFLWNTLSGVLNSGRSIVLTSHSMEECEALCTRLVIMVNGQLKCIGSIQHLKSRYGQGYTLMMKIGSSNPQQQQAQNDTIYDGPKAEHQNGVTNQAYSGDNVDKLQPPQNNPLHRVPSAQTIADNTTKAMTFIQETFPGAYLIEQRQGYLQYQIYNPELRWSQIFGALEERVRDFGVVDYSVSQTSLEQVFINFAKEQHAEDRKFNKGCCSCSCF